ncbi:unnamed protein product [Notodromas monacha]|uniref:Uncharacterized protein n=1 Tax=Notodromas monacha TaxID=399045 RepID=A0A7R9GE17_9CRUS|nr:unnamed protein product [Notodromas monacha]CAG0917795.1 unnamed protein product [Notodromas monacha]
MGDHGDDDEGTRPRRRYPPKPWDSGVSNKIIDRCGPKAAKYLSTEHFRYQPRVPLPLPEEEGRGSAGGSKKSSKGSTRGPLMIGETLFKRYNVPLMPHQPEKEDEWDLETLKMLHFRMQHCDTYAELSGSKLFVVEHYDRGFSLFYILSYAIACGILIQRLDRLRQHEIKFAMSEGYKMLFNGIWWNALTAYTYLMLIQSFGILAKVFAPIQHRLYFMFFSMGIPALTAAYLWHEGCSWVAPILMWTAFLICIMSSGRPTITNRMSDPLADDLFFFCFLALVIQAICAKDDKFLKAVLLLLVAFAYAGPLGYWGPFSLRIAIWAGCIYYALDEIIRVVGSRAGPFTPKKWYETMKEKEKLIQMVINLPLGSDCKLKMCEPGLYGLFAGGPFGMGAFEDDDEKKGGWAALLDFGLDIDLSFSSDDVFFWLFVLATTLLAMYVLHALERLSAKDTCVPEPMPYIKPIVITRSAREECPLDFV